MNILVNRFSVAASSRGVKYYFKKVTESIPDFHYQLAPNFQLPFFSLAQEFLHLGKKGVIFWSPVQRGPLFAQNHVMTVHDCINVEYIYKKDFRLRIYRNLIRQALNNCAAIVAISNTTKDAVVRNYSVQPDKILVISSGYDALKPLQSLHDNRNCSDFDAPYILLVTNSLPHKNNFQGCKAIAQSRAKDLGIKLKIVGSIAPDALNICKSAGIDVVVYNWVEHCLLQKLYQNCLFLFSPSLAEGYNFPIAEALNSHSNVLCSDIPAHKEFYNGFVRFHEAKNIDSMIYSLNTAYEIIGPWYPQLNVKKMRSFKDVAIDYIELFKSII